MCKGLNHYRELIGSMPLDEQTTVARMDIWGDKLVRAGCSDLLVRLGTNCWHEDRGMIEISRHDLFRLAQREKGITRRLILAVFIWGYPTGGQGNNCFEMIDNIKRIAQAFADVGPRNGMGQEDVNELFASLRGSGIGLSTCTKLLYFGSFKVGGYDALILDNKVIRACKRGLFEEFAELSGITYDNGKARYETYLRVMSEVARNLGVENPAKLEMFLFLFGNSLKGHRC